MLLNTRVSQELIHATGGAIGLLAFDNGDTPTRVTGVFSTSHAQKDSGGSYLHCPHNGSSTIGAGFYYADLIYECGNSENIRPYSQSCKFFIRYK